LPRHTDSCKLSEDFKDFCAEKVNKIRSDILLEEDEMRDSFIQVDEIQETPDLNCGFDSFAAVTPKNLFQR